MRTELWVLLLLVLPYFSTAEVSVVPIAWEALGSEVPVPRRARPFQPCQCDGLAGLCDPACCCDLDCKPKQLPRNCGGGDEARRRVISHLDCDANDKHRSSLSKTALCVLTNNNPYLGHIFNTRSPVTNLLQFQQSVKSSKRQREHERVKHSKTVHRNRRYTTSENVQVAHEGTSSIIHYHPLMLPQPWIGSYCSSQPVKYLKESNHKCYGPINRTNCESNLNFNYLNYLVSQSSTNDSFSINLPWIVGNLKEGVNVHAHVKINNARDVFHRLKFDFKTQKISGAFSELSEWYKTTVFESVSNSSSYEPWYDENNEQCHNVVVGVVYSFVWQGDSISRVQVEVDLALVPVTVPDLVQQNVLHGSISNKMQAVEIGVLQQFLVNFINANEQEFKANTSVNSSDYVYYDTSTDVYDFWSNSSDNFFVNTTFPESTVFPNVTSTFSQQQIRHSRVRKNVNDSADDADGSGSGMGPALEVGSGLEAASESEQDLEYLTTQITATSGPHEDLDTSDHSTVSKEEKYYNSTNDFSVTPSYNTFNDNVWSSINLTKGQNFTLDDENTTNSFDLPGNSSVGSAENSTSPISEMEIYESEENETEAATFPPPETENEVSFKTTPRRGYVFQSILQGFNLSSGAADADENITVAEGGLLLFALPRGVQHSTLPWSCGAASRAPVIFGTNVASGCLLTLNQQSNFSLQCHDLQQTARDLLEGLRAATHVDSTPSQGSTASENLLPILGPSYESHPDFNREEESSNENRKLCRVPVRVIYSFWYSCSAHKGVACAAYGIVAAQVRLEEEMVRIHEFTEATSSVWLTSSVVFKEMPSSPSYERFWLTHGDPECRGRECWSHLLRPWSAPEEGIPQTELWTNTAVLGVCLGLIFLVAFAQKARLE